MPLPAWATAKVGPLPVWGWSAIAFTGGVGYVLYQRRRQAAGAGAATLAGNAQAVPSTYPSASDAGGAPGGYGSGLPDNGGGPDWPALLGGLVQTTQSPSPQQAQPQQLAAKPTTALAPAPAISIAPSLLGGGYTASTSTISNPVGSADRDAAASGGFYSPSLTDYATEQPGGIQTVQAGLPGTQPAQGLTYTIYGTNTGSGPVVPASQRIAGERYDASGRVIA